MQSQIKKRILIPAASMAFVSFLSAALIILSVFYSRHQYLFTYAPAAFTESSEELRNPYCGFYSMYGYTLSDNKPVSAQAVQSHIRDAADRPLALLQINLRQFASRDLTDSALAQLDLLLSAWEQYSDCHLILRFLYDWDGQASYNEPRSEHLILRHIDQTTGIVNRYSQTVYIVQGIFVGNYGEMHGSAHLNDSAIRRLTQHLADALEPSIFLSVRTPQHWRTAVQSFDPILDSAAWDGSTASRLGLFNDGMLGSATDLGTYADSRKALLPDAKAASDYSVKGSRSEELDFQDRLCRYVPNGGEAVTANPYNDFPAAVAAFTQMHISYLNAHHDDHVLKKWELATYEGDDCFQGMDGLRYIERHLGYRYTIVNSSLAYTKRGKGPAVCNLTLANRGFAVCYRPLRAELILRHTQTGECYTMSFDTDTRLWSAGDEVTLTLPLDGNAYEPGSYTVYFRLTDEASDKQIRLANTLTMDEAFGYPIAALQLQK